MTCHSANVFCFTCFMSEFSATSLGTIRGKDHLLGASSIGPPTNLRPNDLSVKTAQADKYEHTQTCILSNMRVICNMIVL